MSPINIDKMHVRLVFIRSPTVLFVRRGALGGGARSARLKARGDHPGLINISPAMRLGVTHTHHHGNEFTLPS